MSKICTPEETVQAIRDYCVRHEVRPDFVLIDRQYDADGEVIGFRLSLDLDGRSRGCDETFGTWGE